MSQSSAPSPFPQFRDQLLARLNDAGGKVAARDGQVAVERWLRDRGVTNRAELDALDDAALQQLVEALEQLAGIAPPPPQTEATAERESAEPGASPEPPPAPAPEPDPHRVPDVLAQLPRWGTWRLLLADGGKPRKIPDQNQKIESAAEWRPLAQLGAVDCATSQGLAFFVSGGVQVPSGHYALAVDLDACRDPRTGRIEPWALRAVEMLGHSFTMVSPSGTGLHVWVLVRELPQDVARGPVPVAYPAAENTGDKRPNIQLLGLGGNQYVTWSGQWLRNTTPVPLEVDLRQLIDAFHLRSTGATSGGAKRELPKGDGEMPSLDEIREEVERMPFGADLLAGRWRACTKKSPSEAWHRLVLLVLSAARNHGEQAVAFLAALQWGSLVGTASSEPDRYNREGWIRDDVARIASKARVGQQLFAALDGEDGGTGAGTGAEESGSDGGDAKKRVRRATTPADVIERWRKDGPLVHQPTGIPTFDAMTGGGLVFGTSNMFVGAPDAGKTALMVAHVLDTYLSAGLAVGVLCVDEDDEGLATRLLQRRGFTRQQCERRDPADLDAMAKSLAALPLRFYDETWTIESAIADLAAMASERGLRAAFGVDSLQTVQCRLERSDNAPTSIREQVTARARALKLVAKQHGMIAMATSEMPRAGYRSKKSREEVNALALGKESGSIEYLAKVQVALFSVKGEPDLVQMVIAKNKFGGTHPADDLDAGVYLRLDRATQTFAEREGFDNQQRAKREREEEITAARSTLRKAADAAVLATVILGQPGITAGKAREKLAGRLEGRIGESRWLGAKGALGDALVELQGQRNTRLFYLDGTKLPDAVLDAVDEPERARLKASRAPEVGL